MCTDRERNDCHGDEDWNQAEMTAQDYDAEEEREFWASVEGEHKQDLRAALYAAAAPTLTPEAWANQGVRRA